MKLKLDAKERNTGITYLVFVTVMIRIQWRQFDSRHKCRIGHFFVCRIEAQINPMWH